MAAAHPTKNQVPVAKKQVAMAVNALWAWTKGSASGGLEELMLSEEQIWMQVTVKKIPPPTKRPVRIALPHGLYSDDTAEICLLTKDPRTKYEELLADNPVPRNITVMSVSQLRDEFKPYESKRKLCDSYDLFLADDRIAPMLPRLVGKTFYEKKKQPVTVRITRPTVAADIVKACDSAQLTLGRGACSAIRVGHMGLTKAQVIENILAAIPAVTNAVPKKSRNIQSIYIKTAHSTSLPIFMSLPEGPAAAAAGPAKPVAAAVGGKRKRKAAAAVEDDDDRAEAMAAVASKAMKRPKKRARKAAAEAASPSQPTAPSAKKAAKKGAKASATAKAKGTTKGKAAAKATSTAKVEAKDKGKGAATKKVKKVTKAKAAAAPAKAVAKAKAAKAAAPASPATPPTTRKTKRRKTATTKSQK